VKRWRALKFALVGGCVIALAWLAGLGWFVYASLSIIPDHTTSTDAIVVLTGGRLRVETALDLLSAGRGRKLFVSGVNPRVDRVELLRVDGRPSDDANRITLGHEAGNTLGNARETAEWMQQEGYRSLRLVTSWYHMRRSLLEFARAMPDTQIVAEPVFAAHNEADPWSGRLDLALLTIGEYDKFLATLVRPEIAALWPSVAAFDPARDGPAAETGPAAENGTVAAARGQ
jgi:uncharacterized SAM-binding protein YcdF (DUF218 family)